MLGENLQTFILLGGAPRVVVSTAAFRGSFPGLSGLKDTKMFLPHPLVKLNIVGAPWPRGSVLGLTAPRFEFRILCLEGSVISLISPSSGGSPGPIYPVCALKWTKARFVLFFISCFVDGPVWKSK